MSRSQLIERQFQSLIVPGAKCRMRPSSLWARCSTGHCYARQQRQHHRWCPVPATTQFPNRMWNQQSAALLNVYTRSFRVTPISPPRPARAIARYFFNNPDVLHKNQDLARVDYQVNEKFSTFLPLGERLSEGTVPDRHLGLGALPDSAAGSSLTGQFLVLEPESIPSRLHWQPKLSSRLTISRSLLSVVGAIPSASTPSAPHSAALSRDQHHEFDSECDYKHWCWVQHF